MTTTAVPTSATAAKFSAIVDMCSQIHYNHGADE